MKSKTLLAVTVAGIALVGCDSGDINIQPQTNVQNSNNTANRPMSIY